MVLHHLINLGLHRLHLLVAKTPLCISLKWPSFYFKTFNCSLFSLLVCSSERQHPSVEMSYITENFFKSHLITHIRKEKKKEKRERFYIASVFFNLSLIYGTVVLDSFVCVLNGYCYVKSAQYYVHVDMYRSSHMLLKKQCKKYTVLSHWKSPCIIKTDWLHGCSVHFVN